MKTTFKYRLQYRPASQGFPTDGFVGYEDDGTKYGLLVYSKELTADQIRSYELEPVVSIDEYIGKDIVYYADGDEKYYATIELVSYRDRNFIRLNKKDSDGTVLEREEMLPFAFLEKLKSGEYFFDEKGSENTPTTQPQFAGEKLEQVIANVEIL